MTDYMQRFAVKVTDEAPTYQHWLSIMRFGLPTLIGEPALLAELIARRAEREAKENEHPQTKVFSDYVRKIVVDLDLRFVGR